MSISSSDMKRYGVSVHKNKLNVAEPLALTSSHLPHPASASGGEQRETGGVSVPRRLLLCALCGRAASTKGEHFRETRKLTNDSNPPK